MKFKNYFLNRNSIKKEDKEKLIAEWKALKTRQKVIFQLGMFYLITKEGVYAYDHKTFKRKIEWYQGGCKPSTVAKLQNEYRKSSKKSTKNFRRKTSLQVSRRKNNRL